MTMHVPVASIAPFLARQCFVVIAVLPLQALASLHALLPHPLVQQPQPCARGQQLLAIDPRHGRALRSSTGDETTYFWTL
jgi:hypothetical protein